MEQTKPDITEFYRRVALPLMGLAEVISTKGASPGTVAQRSMQQFDTADEIKRRDTEAARKMAMEEALYGIKARGSEKKNLEDSRYEAKMNAFNKLIEGGSDPSEAYKKSHPFEYAEKTASGGGMMGWMNKQGYEEQQRKDAENRAEQRKIADEKRKQEAVILDNERKRLEEETARLKSIKIPGLQIDNPDMIQPTDSKIVKDAFAEYKNIKRMIKEYNGLYQKHGREILPGSVKNEMDATKNLIAVTMKGPAFAALGVLAGPDMAILDKIIPDATEIGKVDLSSKFKVLDRYVDNKFGTQASIRGYRMPGFIPEFATPEEAETSGYKGVAYIGGRKAVVE